MSSTGTSKGNKTRAARKNFVSKYGNSVATAVRMLVTGSTTDEVASVTNLKKSSVAAIKGNLTRGNYSPYTNSTGSGHCNFRS